MFDPRPRNRDGSPPISQRDHEQLMPKTNLRSVHDQADFFQRLPLGLQPLLCNWTIPLPHLQSWVVQKTTQSPGRADQFGPPRNFAGYPAQSHRTTLIDTDQEPNKIPDLSDSLLWPQFTNSAHPCIIERVGRHAVTPCLKWFPQTYFSGEHCRSTIIPSNCQVTSKKSDFNSHRNCSPF